MKIAALHEDDDERERLLRNIAREKHRALTTLMASPAYKPFVQLNQDQLADHSPRRKAAILEERRQVRTHQSEDAAKRYEELKNEELLQRIDAARRRTGDHWVNGHWSTDLPAGMQSSFGGSTSSPRQPAADEVEGLEAQPPRESTLLVAPGAMYAESTAKGRARRLAAKLAHVRF